MFTQSRKVSSKAIMDLRIVLFICGIFLASSVEAKKSKIKNTKKVNFTRLLNNEFTEKNVCYWMPSVKGRIDPSICTHVIYSFLGVTRTGDITYGKSNEAKAKCIEIMIHESHQN